MSCIKTILNLHEDFESKLSPVSFLSGGPYHMYSRSAFLFSAFFVYESQNLTEKYLWR